MVITLDADLEAALSELARRQRVDPETLALKALRERFLALPLTVQPSDEWERRLFTAATDCGVSLPHSAVSSEGLYE
jgi:predicted transcriptional regulator